MDGYNVILRSNTGRAEERNIEELYESDDNASVQACGLKSDGSLLCLDPFNPESADVALNETVTGASDSNEVVMCRNENGYHGCMWSSAIYCRVEETYAECYNASDDL